MYAPEQLKIISQQKSQIVDEDVGRLIGLGSLDAETRQAPEG